METPLLFGFKGEELVQFANIGCGAVCVLGVVITGFMIFTLTEDTGKVRGPLIRSFMKMCVFLAVISGVSSSALAWQNSQKVAAAETKTAEVRQTAEALVATSQKSLAAAQTSYQALETKLASLTLPAEQKQGLIKEVKDKNRLLLDNRAVLERAAKETQASFKD